MAINTFGSPAQDQFVKQQREQENAPPKEDAGILDMAWDLQDLHEVVDYERYTYPYDPEFTLEAVDKEFNSQSKFVKDAVYEAKPRSREEFNYMVDKYSTLEQDIQRYQGEGASFYAANMLAAMFDPTAVAIGVATGGTGVGFKLAKSTVGAVTAETIAAESAISTLRYINNPTYDMEDAVVDVALSPLSALPVYVGQKLLPTARAARENARKFKEGQEGALRQLKSGDLDLMDMDPDGYDPTLPTNDVESYQSGSGLVNWARTDRHKRLASSGIKGLSEKAHKIFVDPVGSWKDRAGQGVSVDGVVNQITESLVTKYNQEMHGAVKELFGDIRKNLHQQGKYGTRLFHRDRLWREYEKSIKKIQVARELRDASDLTPAELKIMQIESETYKRALTQMQKAGVKGADKIKHDPFYGPIQYSRDKLRSYQKADIVKLFAKGFRAGMSADVEDDVLTKGLPEVLAESMYHKIAKANDGETIYDMLDNPEEFFEYLRMDKDEIIAGSNGKVSAEQLEKLLGKRGADQPPILRGRASLKRTESITLADGSELSILDLAVHDSVAMSHGYVRYAAGLSGLSQGLGIKSMDEWRKFRQKIIDQNNKVQDVQRLLDDIENVTFGRASYKRTEKQNIALNIATSFMSSVGLGFAGAAALVDMSISAFRSGLAASLRTAPAFNKTFKPKDIEEFTEAAASVDVFVNNTQWSNALANLSEDGMESAREGMLAGTTREMARLTVKYSGLSYLTEWTQRQAFFGSANKLFKEARKGKDFHLASAETSWTKAEMDHLRELMRKTPSKVGKDSWLGKAVNVPDLSKWSYEDKQLLFRGLHQFSMRAASRVTRGEQGEWMESAITRVLAQFRAVVLNSFTKRAISGLMRVGTKQGAIATVQSGMAQMAALPYLYWIKAESKMLGMDEQSRNEYLEKLGFDSPRQYDRMFNGSFEERVDAFMNAPAGVLRQIASYSPSHGSLLEVADLVGGAFGADLTGARYRPVEDVMFGAPAIGYVENLGRLGKGLTDGEFNAEDARRMRAAMWMNSHPLMMAVSNSIIEATDLPKEKKD